MRLTDLPAGLLSRLISTQAGVEWLDRKIRKAPGTSEQDTEYNTVLEDWLRSIRPEPETLDKLMTIARWPPVRRRDEAFLRAESAWLRGIAGLRPVAHLLSEDLRRRVYRANAPEQASLASTEAHPYEVRLVRQEGFPALDRWWLSVSGPGLTRTKQSKIYLRTGHLSGGSLKLTVRLQPAGDQDTSVLNVLVEHDPQRHCHSRCRLPAACEVILMDLRLEGYVLAAYISPWRQAVDPAETLLPYVGRKVRIGTLILEASSDAPRVDAEHVNPPPYIKRMEGVEWLGWMDAAFGQCYLRQTGPVISHPDYYPVRIALRPGEIIVARPARGFTQYAGCQE